MIELLCQAMAMGCGPLGLEGFKGSTNGLTTDSFRCLEDRGMAGVISHPLFLHVEIWWETRSERNLKTTNQGAQYPISAPCFPTIEENVYQANVLSVLTVRLDTWMYYDRIEP
jgi:hypothetical protein